MSAAEPHLHAKYVRSQALGEEITELFGFITAATYDLLVKIREFDQEGLWQLEGICSCAHWLNWKCGIGMNAAREKVRVAKALSELPKISEAFRKGEISYSKVRAATRVAHSGNEDYLLMIALHGTAHHVETLVRGYRLAKRLNDEELQDKQHEHRSVSWRWDDDGSLTIKGRLPGEVGAMLVKALDAAIDRQEQQDSEDNDVAVKDRPPKSPDNVVIDLKKRLEDRFIHAHTCVTRWEGEQMDRHLAVGMLCDLDEKGTVTFPR